MFSRPRIKAIPCVRQALRGRAGDSLTEMDSRPRFREDMLARE